MKFKNLLLIIIIHSNLLLSAQNRLIKADVNQVKGKLNHAFDMCVSAGRVHEGFRATWQQQLDTVQKNCGFKYIRMHGLLNDEMGVCYRDERTKEIKYNWQYIDIVYDYLLKIGMKPFVELAFMPDALKSNDKTVFWWKGNISPPKDYDEWEKLIYNLTLHFEQRYGRDEVKKWFFEVWNEPDLKVFFDGDFKEYFKLYKSTVKAVKKVCPDYQVGGPASAYTYINEMLDACSKEKVPLDFLSTHMYNVGEGHVDTASGNHTQIMSKDQYKVTHAVQYVRQVIDKSEFKGLPLYFTEWNSSYSSADPVHDTYINASFFLSQIKWTEGYAQSMSYWTFTDIFEEGGPPKTPFYGGFGMINLQGIKKSTYWAAKYRNMLGQTEIKNNDSLSWITTDGAGNYQILAWDYTLPDQKGEVNQDFYTKDVKPAIAANLTVELTGLADGNYKMTLYQVGYKVNDPYTTYIDMGKPDQLTLQQVEKLNSLSNGAPIETTDIVVKNNSYSKKIVLKQNDVYFISLKRFK